MIYRLLILGFVYILTVLQVLRIPSIAYVSSIGFCVLLLLFNFLYIRFCVFLLVYFSYIRFSVFLLFFSFLVLGLHIPLGFSFSLLLFIFLKLGFPYSYFFFFSCFRFTYSFRVFLFPSSVYFSYIRFRVFLLLFIFPILVFAVKTLSRPEKINLLRFLTKFYHIIQ